MDESSSQPARPSGAAGTNRARRPPGRLITAIAVLGLATASYSLLRLDGTRDRLDALKDEVRALSVSRDLLRTELDNAMNRERRARRSLESQLAATKDLGAQLEQLGLSVEELRGRSEGPERAWSRAEALFLLELAHRRLIFDRDLATAVVALESADARLASLREAAVAPVRAQIARDLQALRSVQQPDLTGILSRLSSLEDQARKVPSRGLVVLERESPRDRDADAEQGWNIVRTTLSRLITVRRVDDRSGAVIELEEQELRRQHLQLLLFSARQAVLRHDSPTYRASLASARQWLADNFEMNDTAAQVVLKEIQALEPINIDPALPDVAASVRMLQRVLPAPEAT
jgi:uroporphyrin-III C-methyltransferase